MSVHCSLLVSVRNADELEAAHFGGADILDVKEPDHGSLGMASIDVLRSIHDRYRQLQVTNPLSVALGELSDWFTGNELCAVSESKAADIALLQPHFVKLGLTGRNDWRSAWGTVRSLPFGTAQWVAVAYADFHRSGAPSPLEVLDEAGVAGCRVLLIDTFLKDGRGLLHWLSPLQLRELDSAANQAGMKLALAGSLSRQDLPEILGIRPDVIAVRGAVCDRGDRQKGVDQCLVAGFRRHMHLAESGAIDGDPG